VFHEGKVFEKLNYMHENPVRRGLVRHPADGVWSNRFYQGV